MTSLLPPPSAIDIRVRRVVLQDKVLSRFDAVLFVCRDNDVERLLARLPHASLWRKLRAELHRGDANGALHARLPNSALTAMTIGFTKTDASPFALLTLAARLIKEYKIVDHRRVLLATLGFDEAQSYIVEEALLAATLAAAAPLPKFKSKPTPPPRLRELTLAPARAQHTFATTLAANAGNHLARWLTTLPPNELTCATYVDAARALAKRHGWGWQFFDERALKRLGAGAFLAVARSNARRGAGIVKLSYRPRGASDAPIALVGKGICFDTGGINLKPHKSMYLMHEDMMGSAVTLGTLLALTELKVSFPVDCWLALTENEIGPNAYRPQEIVTAVNGTTIQVVHSDAEGRMALADTLALASRDRPELILDFATLTGACVGALTERMSGIFTNRPAWRDSLERAGAASGERVWAFPMDEDYDTDLESSIADILQCTHDSKGDHILAARFLARFVGKGIDWVHVDLASSNRPGGLAHIPTDCTGFGVRFAVQWLLKEREA